MVEGRFDFAQGRPFDSAARLTSEAGCYAQGDNLEASGGWAAKGQEAAARRPWSCYFRHLVRGGGSGHDRDGSGVLPA